MENERTDHAAEPDTTDQANQFYVLNQAWNHVRANVQGLITALGQHAVLAIADTYEIEQMGVLIDSPFLPQIKAERDALARNFGEASKLWLQLQESMAEVKRGIGSLRFLIDPANN